MIVGRSARRQASFVAFGATALGVALAFGACTSTPRSNGEACIKGDDCLSGICVQNECVAAPPTLDAETDAPPSDATMGDDATGEGGTTTDTGATADSGATSHDSGKPSADTGSTGPEASSTDSDTSSSDSASE